MKAYFLLSCLIFISVNVIGQNYKINQAETYFKEYRFAEATPIYKELIDVDQIKLVDHENVFRHAIISADKSHDYNFEYELLKKIAFSDKYTFDDAYQFFQLSLYLGFYDKAKEILSQPIIQNSSDQRKSLLDRYQGGEVFNDYYLDTTIFRFAKSNFNSGYGDFNPVYHPNGIVFTSARDLALRKSTFDNSSYLNQYIYQKDSTVKELKFLEVAKHDGTSFYDSINKIWYYSKNLEVNKVTRLSKTGLFIYDEKTQIETPFAYNSPFYFTAQPSLSEDGQTLWFSSDREGGFGKSDIWYSKKNNQTWSEPINAGELINTSENEMFPFAQGKFLYFSSNGHPGLGGLDIYSAINTNGSFSALENLGANLNSNGDDFSLVLDKTEKNGYFASNRENFIDNIYSLKVNRLVFIVKGKFESPNVEYADIKKVPLYVKESGVIIDTLFQDSTLNVQFVAKKNKSYEFEVNEEQYLPISESYSTVGKTVSDTSYKVFELITKLVDVDLFVFDSTSNAPLINAKVNLRNKANGLIESFNSDQNGHIFAKLLRNNEFEIVSEFEGYEYYTSIFNTNTKEKEVKVSIPMKKVEIPLVVGTIIPMHNLGFEFNKWNLDQESKLELDRIANILKENPKVKVEFESHTDSRGSAAYNLNLSKKRTQSAVTYLLSKGVDKNYIDGKWFGETELINECADGVPCTPEQHKENRRTQIRIVSIDK